MVIEESKVQETIKKNLEYLMRKHNLKKQVDLAKEMGVTTSQLSNVMQKKQTPTLFPFLVKIKERFGYSLDEFLFTDIEASEGAIQVDYDVSEENYKKIYGLYELYYFNTSTFKGREYADDAEALRTGILLVCRKNFKTEEHRVFGIFDLKKEDADTMFMEFEKLFKGYNYDNVHGYLNDLEKNHHIYRGNLELSMDHMYFSLQFGVKDKVLMILHNHLGRTLHYRGGLGTLVSVSKGRYASPCMQYIGVSRYSLSSAKEEIAEHLQIHYPPLRTYDATEELTDMLINLYCNNDANMKLFTPEAKKTMVRSNVDKVINETIDKNLFRSASVTSEDDDEWYHYLKRVNNIP